MTNVVYHDFTPNRKPPTKVSMVSGVFVKPCGVDETMFILSGNIGGFIASYIAFHPEFSPSLFGKQVRDEMGVSLINDGTPPDAA